MSVTDDGDDSHSTLFDELEELESLVDSEAERRQVREAMQAATAAQDSEPAVFGRVIWGFDREDLVESLLGSLLFGIPMAVEGGTVDAGRHIAQHPLYFVGTIGTAVAMVVGILYVADFQDVRVKERILGLVPRRLAGVTLTALGSTVALLTAWGLVEWSTTDPALGDILPGS